MRRCLRMTLACLLCTPPLHAQSTGRDSVTLVPGPRYAAGGFHRWLLGPHYRDAWTTPVRVPVLDLGTFAGGLVPVRRGGGFQTRSLRFRGADGREYAFRSVDKDPSAVLPPELRETLVDDLVQDQISAAHPLGAVVVAPILDAVGVLHADPQVVMLPDDARLGEFRAEFGGLLGMIEERPAEGTDTLPGFMGATNVVGTPRLLERIEEDFERVDTRAFLAARLIDGFLGDWDRHRDQWRWARFAETPDALWHPVPRDRDQAFVRMDGLLLALARQYYPQLVRFDESYPRALGLTWNGRELDRRLLVELEWPVWDSVAAALQHRLTDAVIDDAVSRLPPEFRQLDGAALGWRLRGRRDGLRVLARDFYELLAGEVDVHTTDAGERAEIRFASTSELMVHVTMRSAAGDRTVFRRTFRRGETEEVRLFLHGGADTVRVTGSADPGITVRVIGGGGADVFLDESDAPGPRIYDSGGNNVFVRGRGTRVDERAYTYPGPPYSPSQPPRDWGRLYRLPLWAYLAPDVGLFAGAGIERTRYGFRHYPYASRVRLRAAFSSTARTFRAELDARVNREGSLAHWTLGASVSGLEVLRFHGYGNETAIDAPDEYYRVDQLQFALEPRLVLPLRGRSSLAVGPVLEYARTDRHPGRLINVLSPYGSGNFGQAGLRAELQLDARDRQRAASRGVWFTATGTVFPAVWHVEKPFAALGGEAAAYYTPPVWPRPTLALRAGGRRLFGRYPFSQAAYLGDDATVRLGRKQRYAGDAEVHGNAELRLKLGRALIVLPADIGVFGLADTGRVFYQDETSNRWHSAVGGGVWVAFLQPQNTLSLALARSTERLGVYIGAGFAF